MAVGKYDNLTKKFIETSASGQSDKSLFDEVQDPTFMTFKIDFFPDNGNSATANDGFSLGGLLRRPVDKKHGFSNFVGENDNASDYFRNIGSPSRYAYLELFIDTLDRISNDNPWYFQSVTGLGDIYKFEMADGIRLNDKSLTIECLETLDMKMSYLADLYRNAVYDQEYMREMLPYNLRTFDMKIHVLEMRNFNTTFGTIASALRGDSLNSLTGDKIKELITTEKYESSILQSMFEAVSVETFHFRNCEFDFHSEAPGYLDTVHTSDSPIATYKFKIKVGQVEKTGVYPFFNAIISDVAKKSGISYNTVSNAIANTGRTASLLIKKSTKHAIHIQGLARQAQDQNGTVIENTSETRIMSDTSTASYTTSKSIDNVNLYYDDTQIENIDDLGDDKTLLRFRDYRNAIFPTIYADDLSEDARIIGENQETLGVNTTKTGEEWPRLKLDPSQYAKRNENIIDFTKDSAFNNNRLEQALTRNIRNKTENIINNINNKISSTVSQLQTNAFQSVGALTGGLLGQPNLGNVFTGNQLINSVASTLNQFLGTNMQVNPTPLSTTLPNNSLAVLPTDNTLVANDLKVLDAPGKLSQISLKGAPIDKTLTKETLKGAPLDKNINKVDLDKLDVDTKIVGISLKGSPLDTKLEKGDLIGSMVDKVIKDISLDGVKQSTTIIDNGLDQLDTSDKIIQVDLKGTNQDTVISSGGLIGQLPDSIIGANSLKLNDQTKEIKDDSLKTLGLDDKLKDINLVLNEQTKKIQDVQLVGQEVSVSISSNSLKGAQLSDTISKIDLVGSTESNKINDIQLKGKTVDDTISTNTLKELSVDNSINKIELVGKTTIAVIKEDPLEGTETDKTIGANNLVHLETDSDVTGENGLTQRNQTYNQISERILKRLKAQGNC